MASERGAANCAGERRWEVEGDPDSEDPLGFLGDTPRPPTDVRARLHPCFVAPLEVGALLDAAHAVENVARALIARGAKPTADEMERKHVEGLAEGRTEGRTEGHAEGRTEGRTEADRRSIRELCDVLEVAWTAKRAAEVLRLDGDALRVLRADLVRQRRWPSR